jgi:segregation and condensation protein A
MILGNEQILIMVEQETAQAVQEQEVIRVSGEVFTEMPQDLYIPPEALRIFLEAFEGPMDLLLYLIKKQNLDILDIPIAEITAQYIKYIELMQNLEIALAAEYLVMAATLAEIKSRWLLPRADTAEDEYEGDPRAELIRRLQEYERYKHVAERIDLLPRLERELSLTAVALPKLPNTTVQPDVSLEQLSTVFAEVMRRAKLEKSHRIEYETLSVRERMAHVLQCLGTDDFTEFSKMFDLAEGTMGVTVTFIAILELAKQSALEFTQRELFGEIYVRARVNDTGMIDG